MILDDIIYYLSGAAIGLTSGTNLFASVMPDAPDRACGVYEAGGYSPIHAMSGSAGSALVERPRVQVITRAGNYQAARQLAQNVFQSLDGLTNAVINNTNYLLLSAVASPAAMGLDSTGRHRIVINFDVIKKVSTSTST